MRNIENNYAHFRTLFFNKIDGTTFHINSVDVLICTPAIEDLSQLLDWKYL